MTDEEIEALAAKIVAEVGKRTGRRVARVNGQRDYEYIGAGGGFHHRRAPPGRSCD